METQVRVNAYSLDVCASNALAFLPALSQVQVARLAITPDAVEITATDMYAAGRDSCPVLDMIGDAVTILIDRQGLTDLAGIGRKDKKAHGTLTVEPAVGWRYEPPLKTDTWLTGRDVTPGNRVAWEMFEAIDDMLEHPQEFRTAFQPQLLTRFGKVTADKDSRVADVAIDDPDAPVLIKVGSSFKGLIMPVSRDAHVDLVGQEGLW